MQFLVNPGSKMAQHVENGNQLVSPVWEQWGGQGIGAHTGNMKPGTTLRQAPKQGLNLTSVLRHTKISNNLGNVALLM